jgi:hypothetical protein
MSTTTKPQHETIGKANKISTTSIRNERKKTHVKNNGGTSDNWRFGWRNEKLNK